MKKVKRMNNKSDTAGELVAAARELFSRHGYDGTSVRAITAHAGANLGAITYHFGSKEALYEATLGAVTEPIRAMVARAAEDDGSPIERIEQAVRAFFKYLRENPEFPNLIAHQLASTHPFPEPARETISRNLQLLSSLISQGQADGTIRSGNPDDMALSITSQPMWLNLARRALKEGTGLDQDDPDVHERIVESAMQFIKAGLVVQREDHQP